MAALNLDRIADLTAQILVERMGGLPAARDRLVEGIAGAMAKVMPTPAEIREAVRQGLEAGERERAAWAAFRSVFA